MCVLQMHIKEQTRQAGTNSRGMLVTSTLFSLQEISARAPQYYRLQKALLCLLYIALVPSATAFVLWVKDILEKFNCSQISY